MLLSKLSTTPSSPSQHDAHLRFMLSARFSAALRVVATALLPYLVIYMVAIVVCIRRCGRQRDAMQTRQQ